MSKPSEKRSRPSLHVALAAVSCVLGSLPLQASKAVTGTPEETPIASPVEKEEAKTVEEYWTEERMREAKPMPMPSPEKRAPSGRSEWLGFALAHAAGIAVSDPQVRVKNFTHSERTIS